ncbi:MAG: 2-C-methyl-D-erythritol 2,4-cyclodiphosphate synthase [Chloroflexi bacterium]|nr:2-C-methyl-D-erythritol 2,4-cyclodiphosphate synthase [Chloroflexota bacterium]
MTARAGIGYDVHRLVRGRRLVLGGVEVPYGLGLAGHSDADVVIHAIIDALLGAAARGDIGTYFPPDDPQYEGISSLTLLRQVGFLVEGDGWHIDNVDVTIVAQRPQMAPYIDAMRQQISRALGLFKDQVSIKATTTEGLGFVGREEGMAAHAVAILRS